MAPRPRPASRRLLPLKLLPAILLPLGCAAEGAESAALREALDGSRASLAALGQAGLPVGGPVAMPVTATAGPNHAVALAVPNHAVPADAPAPAALPPQFPATGQAAPQAAAQFLGAGPAELRGWLGEPALRRAEGPAEVWLYLGGSCALDIVLYREGHGRLHVAHAAARANGAEPRTEAACLGEIAASPAIRRGAGA